MAGDVRFTLDSAALRREVVPIMLRTASKLTRQIATQAKMNAPVKTGNLRGLTEQTTPKMSGPFRVTGEVESTAEYAEYVHEGTRPHVIRPRNAAALHFYWKGREVFAQSVNHPGTRPRPFLRNAAEDVLGRY